MSNLPDLVTLAQTTTALAQSLPTDQSALPTVISAASNAIQNYCKRVFTVNDYTAIKQPMPGQWDKGEPDVVHLDYYPVVPSTLNPVARVRAGRTPALMVSNTNTSANQQAYVYFNTTGNVLFGLQRNVGLTLVSIASGVMTSTSIPFFGTPTSAGFSVVATGSGSSLSAGTYQCSYTNVNAAGESVNSASVSVTITAGQNLLFTLPPLIATAVSNNVYVSATNGGTGTETRQNATAITGTAYTVSSLALGASPPTTNTGTVAQLAAAINAVSGWQALVQTAGQAGNNYGNYASSDLFGSEDTMGALAPLQAPLTLFASGLIGLRFDAASGTVYLPQSTAVLGGIPGSLWLFPGGSDYAMTQSSWRGEVLVQYAAGFATIPEDVQQACYVTIKAMIQSLQTITAYSDEKDDLWQAKLSGADERAIPLEARRLLAEYRVHRA